MDRDKLFKQAMERVIATRMDFVLYRAFEPHVCAFISTIVNGFILIPNDTFVPTLATDGRILLFNPEYVMDLAKAELAAGIMHEGLHPAFLHHLRRGKRDGKLHNIAGDAAINPFIRDVGGQLPRGVVYPENFNAAPYLSSEEYYAILESLQRPPEPGNGPSKEPGKGPPPPEGYPGTPQKPDPNRAPGDEERNGNSPGTPDPDKPPKDGNDGEGQDAKDGKDGNDSDSQQGGGESNQQPDGEGQGEQDMSKGGTPKQIPQLFGSFGDVVDAGTFSGDSETIDRSMAEQEWKVRVAQASYVAQSLPGKMPGALAKIVNAIVRPRKPFIEELAEFIRNTGRNRPCWKRPSRRWMASGSKIIMPSRRSPELPELAITIDTSGSISDREVALFLTILDEVCTANPHRLHLFFHTTDVWHPSHWEPGDGALKHPANMRRGGTSHVHAFKLIAETVPDAAAIICLTDMETVYPDQRPFVPTLWCTTRNFDTVPPFGRLVPVHFAH